MIDFRLSSWDDSYEAYVLPSSSQINEGMYITKTIDQDDGKMKVFTPAGENTEQFAGLALAQRRSDTNKTMVERVVFPALAANATTVSVSISNAPNNPTTDVMVISEGGDLSMMLSDANTGDVVANTAGYFNTSGNVITAYEGWAGLTAYVTYTMPVSADLYYRQYGDPYQGLLATNVTGTMGVITRGVAFSTYFNTGDNWASYSEASVVKVSEGGIITIASGATGATIGNCSVEQVPTVSYPTLGFRFSVA